MAIYVENPKVNLIPFPYSKSEQTVNGITFTPNDDGSISVKGTATANINYIFTPDIHLKANNKYTYSCNIKTTGLYVITAAYKPNGSLVENYHSVNLNRESYTFTFSQEYFDLGYGVRVKVYISSGVTVNETIPAPILTEADNLKRVTPYVKANWKNLIPCPFYFPQQTRYGITFTPNADGSVTLNGTATGGNAYYQLMNYGKPQTILKAGTYTVFMVNGSKVHYISLAFWNGSTWIKNIVFAYDAPKTFTITQEDIEKGYGLAISVHVAEGSTANNKKVYPMIVEGDTAKPYIKYGQKLIKTKVYSTKNDILTSVGEI